MNRSTESEKENPDRAESVTLPVTAALGLSDDTLPLGKLLRRHRNEAALAFVLWDARFRLCPKASKSRLIELLEKELEKQRKYFHFTPERPKPSGRTLRRILDAVEAGAFVHTGENWAAIGRFQRRYDRHAKHRMELIEIDGTMFDVDCLALKGIDFVTADDEGLVPVEAWALNAKCRVSKACLGARVLASRPRPYDTVSFMKGVFLGEAAPELGFCGVADEARFDQGGENPPGLIKVLKRVGTGVSYARSGRPEDKPMIERFHHVIWSHVHIADAIRIRQLPDGSSYRYVTLAALRKAYEAARKRYQYARPQRPPNAPSPLDRWLATSNSATAAHFDATGVSAQLYLEFTVPVVGQIIEIGRVRIRSADLESFEKVRARIIPHHPGFHIHCLDEDGAVISHGFCAEGRL